MKTLLIGLLTLSSLSASANDLFPSIECTIQKGFLNEGQKIVMYQTNNDQNRGMGIGGAEFIDLGTLVPGDKLVAARMSNIDGNYTLGYISKTDEKIKATVISDRSWGATARTKRFNIKVIISGSSIRQLGAYHTYIEAKCKLVTEGF